MHKEFKPHKLILCFLLIISLSKLFVNDALATPNLHNPARNFSIINVQQSDSIITDSIPKVEEDLIGDNIFYDAADSIILDAIGQRVLLYGNAVVKFEKMELQAAFIEYNFNERIATAQGVPDSTGTLIGTPVFIDNGQEIKQEYLRFNFETKKGYSKKVVTQQGEAYLHTSVSKVHENQWVHIRKGKFTTCDAENPHYHFQLSRAIAIPDDKIITGPVIMKVRKVPVPLALPFGFFPNKSESTHGILLPSYGDANNLGFFLQDAGYYIPIGKTIDTKLLFDIYSRGSWSVKNVTNYKKRYKYSGSFNISQTIRKNGFKELPSYTKSKDFFIRWDHRNDSKARPNTSFSANLNFGSNSNFRNNINTSQSDYLSNTFSSGIQWSKSWSGKPRTLSVRGGHTQNTLSGIVNVTLPSLSFSSNSNLSILNKEALTKKKWYDKIRYSYSINAENQLSADDSEFRFDNTNELFHKAKNGIKQSLTVSAPMKMLRKLVTINPSFSYNEYWTAKYLDVHLEDNVQQRDTLYGFQSARDWKAAVTTSTKIFGTFNFKNSKNLKAIRHVMTPSLGLSYTPEYDRKVYGNFGDDGEYDSYNPFDVARYRPIDKNEAGSINFGLGNNLEMKVRDKKADKLAYKKVKIIEMAAVSSSYNLIADSLNLSTVSLRANTLIAKRINVNYSSRFNAYDRDSLGREINTFLWDSKSKLARMESSSIAVGLRFRSESSKRNGGYNGEESELEEEKEPREGFIGPWNFSANYSLNLNRNFDKDLQRDSSAITQSIIFNGEITVFKKWKVGVNSGYDLVQKDWTATTINLHWDLHCWELNFNWIPHGIRKSYSIQLNVKASMLQDLKLKRQGNLGDPDLLY